MVATPIGNRDDISARALEVLRSVDVIAAEDTRHSRRLLNQYGIKTSLIAYHEHNEVRCAPRLLRRLESGDSVALISDAGTPLISDPGYRLVAGALERGWSPVPVPGPSAVLAALSVSGLPTDRFQFEGFLPSRSPARRARLEALKDFPHSLVLFESVHRIVPSLNDLAEIFGPSRPATLARELTKRYETLRHGSLAELAAWVAREAEQRKGEFVLVVAGAGNDKEPAPRRLDPRAVLDILADELPARQAVGLAGRLTGHPRNELYRWVLERADAADP